MHTKSLFLLGLVLVLGAVLVACSSTAGAPDSAPATSTGFTEIAPTALPATEIVPTETQAPTPTTDMTAAIKPIFAGSPHGNTQAPAFTHWDTAKPQEVPAVCAHCHTSAGFQEYLAMGKVANNLPAPAGPLECATCHQIDSMPERRAVKEVSLPSGKVVSFGDTSDSNLCIECHQARTSKQAVNKQISDFQVTDPDAPVKPIQVDGVQKTFGFIDSHYQGVAGIWFGSDAQIAYEYDSKSYAGAFPHMSADTKNLGCAGCHDPHAGTVRLDLCKTCHAGIQSVDQIRAVTDLTDWNGDGDVKEGINAEYQSLRSALLAEIVTYTSNKNKDAIEYDPSVRPFWFIDENGDGKHNPDEKAFTAWTARLLKAAYNYNFLSKSTGAAYHNPSYVLQIAYDSIADLGGNVSKFTRPQ
jgi:hypothetical protein